MAVIQCTCRPTFTWVADLPARMRLQSSTSDQLIVSSYNLATVSRRAFSVSAANLWKSIHSHLTSAPSFTVFQQRLKSFIFRRSSYLIIWHSEFTVCCGPSNNFDYSGYIKNVVDDDHDDDTSLISAEVPRRDHWQPHVLWHPRQSCHQVVQLPHSRPATRA